MKTDLNANQRSSRRQHSAGAADTALPYPNIDELTEGNFRLFYLAHWMAATSEQEAYATFVQTEAVRKPRRASHALSMAIITGAMALEDREREMAALLRDNGGILFAWAGTTALGKGGAL